MLRAPRPPTSLGRAVLSAGYTLREPPPSLLERPVTEQANVSAYAPITDHWSVFGALSILLRDLRR